MQSRLLIINCPSKYFFYIPVGTFGICDYLARKQIPAKILNLALYKETEVSGILRHHLESFRPTHVGLILHWQETAEGFLQIGEKIKSFNKDVRIISGGFTAGYFGKNLLDKCRFLDFVIKGDPEKPLELLLTGVKPSGVPNLIYRNPSGTKSNRISYLIDENTLSGVSFSGLNYLFDYELYIDAINRKLGFPIFIGRGCVHGCRYCGGSCAAFRLHSGRGAPVKRRIDAVIADLKRLKDYTRKIYLCYENDRDYMKTLFRAIKREQSLMKTFHLNYGAWQLPDEEFLQLHKELFISLGNIKPVVELSPEVFDDKGRKRIKKGSVYYSAKELKENLRLINNHFGNAINVSVFFSRYHETVETYADMKKEIFGVFKFEHELLCENITNARICYGHLSTDVASRYWEEYVVQSKNFGTLISAVRKFKKKGLGGFPADNLCAYTPENLSKREIFRCELLISILRNLENFSREMFHIMFKCLDDRIIKIIDELISERYSKQSKNGFFSFSYNEFLKFLKQKMAADKFLLGRMPFILDLTNFNIKKLEVYRSRFSPNDPQHSGIPKLNYELISVHDNDYLDLHRFLKRLDNEDVKNLKTEKTVCLFLSDEILSMPYETFDVTLKEFEKGISVDEYFELMKKRGIFSPSYHERLIDKLLLSKVLI